MSSIKKSQFHYTQILYFSINIFPVPIFCIKILSILPKLHEKTLSCFGNIKLFSQSFWRYQSFFLECSEWEFSGWGFSGGNSPGGGGSLMGRNFPGGNFIGWNFPRTIQEEEIRMSTNLLYTEGTSKKLRRILRSHKMFVSSSAYFL